MTKLRKGKNLILVFMLLLCLISFSGCDKITGSSSVTKLTFWVPFDGGDGANMRAITTAFNKSHKDIHVQILNIPWGDYYTKLRVSVVAASAPDIAICHASKLAQMAATGNLENLTPLAEKIHLKWNSFSENPLHAGNFKGTQYGLPLDTHAFILYYNVDILRKCGILASNDSKLTFPEGIKSFFKYLKIIKEKAPGIFPFGGYSGGATADFWIWYCFYSQFKDAPEYISETKAQFANKYGLKALEVVSEMCKKGYWPFGIYNSLELFKNGKSAMMFEGVWGMVQVQNTKNLNFRVEPIPKLFDRQSGWGDSHLLVLPVQSDKKRELAAMKFINWASEHSSIWASAGHIPARKSVLNSKEFKEMKYREDYKNAANITLRMPDNEYLSNVNDEMARDIGEMMNNHTPPEETLKKMTKDINQILQF